MKDGSPVVPPGWQSGMASSACPGWMWRSCARLVAAWWKLRRLAGRPADPYGIRSGAVDLGPSDALRPLLAAAPRRLARREEDLHDAAALARWQAVARDRLTKLLRLEGRASGTVAATHHESVRIVGVDPGGAAIRLHRMALPLAPGRRVPIAVLAADKAATERPVLLWQAGSGAGMHLAWGEMRQPADYQRLPWNVDIARQAAARGWTVVCVEQFGLGERRERRHAPTAVGPNTANAFAHAVLLGRSLVGERVADAMAAVDWVRAGMRGMTAPPPADPERLLLAGHSSGGMTALFAAAVDTRVTAAVVSGSLGFVRDTVAVRSAAGGEGIVPGLLDWFESDDILALVAPRPFAAVSGSRDHIYPAAGAVAAVDAARPAWVAAGAGGAVHALSAEGGHRLYADALWDAVAAVSAHWSARTKDAV